MRGWGFDGGMPSKRADGGTSIPRVSHRFPARQAPGGGGPRAVQLPGGGGPRIVELPGGGGPRNVEAPGGGGPRRTPDS
jgi:hypothetical protein